MTAAAGQDAVIDTVATGRGSATAVRTAVAPLVISVLTLSNLAWMLLERRGQPLDIDESGYVSISLNDFIGLHSHGLVGWWRTVVEQGVQAPLAPAIASLIDWATGPRVVNAFVVSALAYGAILLAAYGLSKEMRPVGRVLTVGFLACSPVLLDYSRGFNFSELAAAFLALALYFQKRSHGFTRVVPSLGWGACLGLMILARTMTVAFLPGLLVAAVVLIATRFSWDRLWRLAAGLALATAMACTWYVHNFESVYSYLTSAGYGAQASQYGASRSLLSVKDWYQFWMTTTNGYLFAGESIFMFIGWTLAGVAAIRSSISAASAEFSLRSLAARAREHLADSTVVVPCAIVAVSGMAALMSSRNQGSAFVAPLAAPLVVVASFGFSSVLAVRPLIGPNRLRTTAVALVAGLLAVPAIVAAVLTYAPVPVETVGAVPWFGANRLIVWDSRSTIQLYEDAGNIPRAVEPDPGSTATGRAWLAASAFIDDEAVKEAAAAHTSPLIVFTFNDRLLNVNTVNLDSLVRRHYGLPLALMAPLPDGTPSSAYFHEMAAFDAHATVVATVSAETDEFQPAVPPTVGPAYAHLLHFASLAQRTLPDGQLLTLWSRVPQQK